MTNAALQRKPITEHDLPPVVVKPKTELEPVNCSLMLEQRLIQKIGHEIYQDGISPQQREENLASLVLATKYVDPAIAGLAKTVLERTIGILQNLEAHPEPVRPEMPVVQLQGGRYSAAHLLQMARQQPQQ